MNNQQHLHKQRMVPQECLECDNGRNCINGRRCMKLNRYVEHASEPPCADGKTTTSSTKGGL